MKVKIKSTGGFFGLEKVGGGVFNAKFDPKFSHGAAILGKDLIKEGAKEGAFYLDNYYFFLWSDLEKV